MRAPVLFFTALHAALALVPAPALSALNEQTGSSQTSVSSQATPLIVDVWASPKQPAVEQAVVFTAQTNIPASKVEFQFSGGSRQLMKSSNGGTSWNYLRSEGLKDTTVKYYAVYVNGSNTAAHQGQIQAKAANPSVDTVSASPSSPTVGQPVTFYAKTSQIVQVLEFQFSGGGRQRMISGNGQDWSYTRTEGLSDTNVKSFSIYINGSSTSSYNGSIQAKPAAQPVVRTVTASPEHPMVGQAVSFQVSTDIAASAVEFQFDNGIRHSMLPSSDRRDWTYLRPEGLSDTQIKNYHIYINGSSTTARSGSIQAKLPAAKVNRMTATPAIPEVGESVTFVAITENAHSKVEFQFSNGSRQSMVSGNQGKEWTYVRREGLSDTSLKSYSIFIDGSNTASHNGTIQATSGPAVTGVTLTPSQPAVKEPFTVAVSTDKAASSVAFQLENGTKHAMAASNGGRTWNYTRNEGLADSSPKHFAVFINGKQDPSRQGEITAKDANVAPKIKAFSIAPEMPEVKQPIVFTASLDRAASKVEFQFTGGDRHVMQSSNAGIDWRYDRHEGLADTQIKSYAVFINGSSTPAHQGTIQAKPEKQDLWKVNAGEQSHAVGGVVNVGQRIDVWWKITNAGNVAWSNYRVEECLDAQASQCSPIQTTPSTAAGGYFLLSRSFTMPGTAGTMKRWYRLKSPSGQVVKNGQGDSLLVLNLEVQDLSARLCKDAGTSCSTLKTTYDQAVQACMSAADTPNKLDAGTYTINGITFTAERAGTEWYVRAAFTAPATLSGADPELSQTIAMLNEIRHAVLPVRIGTVGTNNKTQYCNFVGAQHVMSHVLEPDRKQISQSKLQWAQSMGAATSSAVGSAQWVEPQAPAQPTFGRQLSFGLADALIDENELVNQVIYARANWQYAISRSVSDFFVDDVRELLEVKDVPKQLASLLQQLKMFESMAGDLSAADLEALANSVSTMAQHGFISNPLIVEKFLAEKFKPKFAALLGITDRSLMDSPEFGYLLGYYGGQFIVDFVQTKMSYLGYQEIYEKAGKKISQKAFKSVFKYAKVADRLANGVQEEAIGKLNTDSGLAMLRSLRDVMSELRAGGMTPAAQNEETAMAVTPFLCGKFDQYPTPADLKNAGCSQIGSSSDRFGFMPKAKYALLKESVGDNRGKQRAYSGVNELNCDVHHIIPHSIKVKSSAYGYRFFENDSANFVVLPAKNNSSGKEPACGNGGRAVTHSAHPYYNSFLRIYFLSANSGFSTPATYIETQNILRVLLKTGRGIFPLRKSDPLDRDEKPRIDKKRQSTAMVDFLTKYMKHFGY